MKKNNLITIILFCIVGITLGCVLPSGNETGNAIAADEIDAVNDVIEKFQDSYTARNETEVRNLFHYKAVVGIDFDNNTKQDIMSLTDWIIETKDMFKREKFISDQLTNRKIEIHRNSMATVVCDYDYRDSVNHQAGVDIFTLMKIRGEWKIISLIFSGDSIGGK